MPQADWPTFVTIADAKYQPGLVALLYSLRRNGEIPTACRFELLVNEEPAAKVLRLIEGLGVDLRVRLLDTLGTLDARLRITEPRFVQAAKKLLIFNLPVEGKLCFIDSDMLCLSSIADITRYDHFSVAADVGKPPSPSVVFGGVAFNTGFFVFRSDPDLTRRILDFIVEQPEVFGAYGDQDALNAFFYKHSRHDVALLDGSWNCLKRRFETRRSLRYLDGVRMLHFVGRKPWEPQREPDDELAYLALDRLWWHYFAEAGGPAVFPGLSPPSAYPIAELKLMAARSRKVIRTLKGAVRKPLSKLR